MALRIGPVLGKVLYGALFTILLPAGLAAWAYGARANVTLPGVQSASWGAAVACAGLLLWASGVVALRAWGGGLPMNAFPPPRLVSRGVYAAVPHPIYAGFTLVSGGLALLYGSAAGLWLVTPMLALAGAALWWGYERIDLRSRLGPPPRAPWLGVPFASPDAPRLAERIGSLVLALAAPALAALVLDGAGLAGRAPYLLAVSPLRVWAALALAIGGVLAVRSCTDLRDIVLTSLVGSLLITLLVLSLPAGPFDGRLPLAPDGAALAVVAMTGLLALLRRAPGVTPAARWALSMSAGLFLLGRGPLPSPESILGAVAFGLASARWHFWSAILRFCERVANSWRETDIGAFRIIHIGWLAALPAAAGAGAAVILVGPSGAILTLWVFVSMIVGAALWAQFVEGSPALSRPYGFFGAVVAVAVFSLAVAPTAFHVSAWLVPAVFATLAPWAQGLARLRCLANGCCHGAPCHISCGVVYRNPRTRVVRLAGLGGVPIHPTQLYSLAGNAIIGALMVRLWAERVPFSMITGVYFSLMGLARFAEEGWRGEPQTPTLAGLRLYQWVSIACFVGGAALTVIRESPNPGPPAVSLAALWTGLAAGAVTWLAVSIDFPRSKRRFARLA